MNTFQLLSAQRKKLQDVRDALVRARRDMLSAQTEGQRDASVAAFCGAVVLFTDVVRISLSAVNPIARKLFEGMDDVAERADKAIEAVGGTPSVKKDDLLGNLDPRLRSIASITGSLRDARAWFGKLGGVENKQVALLSDLALAMTEDTLLMLDAGMSVGHISQQARTQLTAVDARIQKIDLKLRLIDQQLIYIFQLAEIQSRTA